MEWRKFQQMCPANNRCWTKSCHGLNLIGLRRRGVSRNEISELKKLYRDFFNVPGNLKARASDLLDSKKPPETEIGIRFVEFFLTGDRSFSRSRMISKTEINLETEEE